MSDLLLRIRSWIFGTKWVVLIDHDGDRFVRRMYFAGGQAMAKRHSRPVQLLDNGAVRGVSYVDAWAPYDPREPKRYPVFDRQAPSKPAQGTRA